MKNILKYDHLVSSRKDCELFFGNKSCIYSRAIDEDSSDGVFEIQIKRANLKKDEKSANVFDVWMSFRTQLESGVKKAKTLTKPASKNREFDKEFEAQDYLAKFRHLLTCELEQNILHVVRENADSRREIKEELRNTIVAAFLLLQKVEKHSVVGGNNCPQMLKSAEFNSFNFSASKDRLYRFKFNLNNDNVFKKDLAFAVKKKLELEDSSIINDSNKIEAFQKTFDSMQKFETYLEKAKEYQEEIDRARKISRAVDCDYHLNEDLKRYVFSNIRDQNYRASLRLEGLHPTLDSAAETLQSLRTKYVG